MSFKKKIIEFGKLLSQIELVYILVIMIIGIIFVFIGYQYISIIPKKMNISAKTEELLEDEVNIESITRNKKSIICSIDKKYFPEEEYNNYVLGEGKGIKINCSILLKKNNEYYKIKTLFKCEEDDKIVFVGYVDKKYLLGDYEVLLYNNENSQIYRYIGDINER